MSRRKSFFDSPFLDQYLFSGSKDGDEEHNEKKTNSFGKADFNGDDGNDDDNNNDDFSSSEQTFFQTTSSSKKGDGVRSHELNSYRTSDGKEITKETRKIGDQIHHVTTIKGPDAKDQAINSNLQGKDLEDFNSKWKSYDASGSLLKDHSETQSGKKIGGAAAQMKGSSRFQERSRY
jgi:hypothetical protein